MLRRRLSTISMSAAARPLLSLNERMRGRPLTTSIVVTTAKAGLADLMVQMVVERRKEVDRRRLATFLIFGGAYQGCFQHWVFNCWFERLFPGAALIPTIQKVLAANLIADPVFFFPTFYTLKEALARPPEEALRLDTVRVALNKYYTNCFVDWRNTWGVWFGGHVVTFGLMPMHLRMPWIAAVSFGYLSLLSVTRGEYGRDETRVEAAERPLTAAPEGDANAQVLCES